MDAPWRGRFGFAWLCALAVSCAGARDAAPEVVAPEVPVEAATELPEAPALATPRMARSVEALMARFDPTRALATVAYVDGYFRVRGNRGYVKSLQRVEAELRAGGFDAAHVRRLALGEVRPTWSPTSATLELLGGDAPVRLVHFSAESEPDRAALLVGSSATPTREFEVVTVAQVQAGASLDGRLLLAEGDPRGVFARARLAGAAGVLVHWLHDYHQPEANPTVAQFGYLGAHEGQAVGFSLSRQNWERMVAATANGPATVRVSVDVSVGSAAAGAVEARIDGTQENGAIVYVAHVDEPGANDNGSGVAALAELARSMRAGIEAGELPRPTRPIVFLWGQEMEIARTWLEQGPADRAGAGLVLDMVGQDPEIVGAPFLIERMPDPGAVWLRAPDEHTEWGSGDVSEDQLSGHFLNALASAAAAQVPGTFTWRDNPFEGGSDHVPFLERGHPAVLGWHFTDSAYHTTADRIDRVSGPEMQRVASTFGALGIAMASEADEDSVEMLAAVEHHAYVRLRHAHAAALEGADATLERRVFEAWIRWYDEAFSSVAQWPAAPSPALVERVDEMRARWAQHGAALSGELSP